MPREKSYVYPTVLVEKGKLPGVPSRSEILHLSIGKSFISRYKKKYAL